MLVRNCRVRYLYPTRNALVGRPRPRTLGSAFNQRPLRPTQRQVLSRSRPLPHTASPNTFPPLPPEADLWAVWLQVWQGGVLDPADLVADQELAALRGALLEPGVA